MEMINLFPTPLGIFNLTEINDEERKFLLSQKKRKNSYNRTSENHYLLEEEIMKPLKSQIEYCVSEYANETLAQQDQTKIAITQSWTNYSKKDESHHSHYHMNSVISGVYYVETTDEDTIVFTSNRQQGSGGSADNWTNLGVGEPKKTTAYNSENTWVYAVKGSLFLFPSTLFHSVSPIKQENHERVSLSFNTFFRGEIGSKDRLNHLFIGE